MPRDFLPENVVSFPSAYIFNKDTSSQGGSHWLLLVFQNNETAYLFDSFGYKPQFYNLEDVLEGYNCIYNEIRLQSKNSNVCGYFCIYVAYMLAYNVPFNDIINGFDVDYIVNDYTVVEYISTFDILCSSYKKCGDWNQTCKCMNYNG